MDRCHNISHDGSHTGNVRPYWYCYFLRAYINIENLLFKTLSLCDAAVFFSCHCAQHRCGYCRDGRCGKYALPFCSCNYFFISVCGVSYYLPYRKIANVLKWLCLTLILYIIVPFLVKQNSLEILKATFLPKIKWNNDYIAILVAILGTTISPYLFFWQASMENEELGINIKTVMVDKAEIKDMQFDVKFGMFFSNLVMYFIILATGSVLFRGGVTNINTVQDAASALKPLAGDGAYWLFAIGVIGTGLLAIPVLAGSVSYMLAETFGWKEGLNKKWHEAKGFYLILGISIVIGFAINLLDINPIKALIYTAVAYGVTAPVLIALILHICNNKKIMGEFTNKFWSNFLGWITLALMTFAAVALFVTM
jgi:Mn2+/Fe2+ NRAMP family transporter